ncbi:hypothetical protein SNE40_014573 [Patella caerulea]|uniref:Homeobox domain-containing protein n=1 Tax=Patella caerulea TaxID=87958 RepID=A0AAN8JFY0_PATCE
MKTQTSFILTDKQPFKGVIRRERTKYTKKQLNILESVFRANNYPDSCVFEQLCYMLKLDVEKLATWFQNRRCKEKRQNKENHREKIRQEIFNPKFVNLSCDQPEFMPKTLENRRQVDMCIGNIDAYKQSTLNFQNPTTVPGFTEYKNEMTFDHVKNNIFASPEYNSNSSRISSSCELNDGTPFTAIHKFEPFEVFNSVPQQFCSLNDSINSSSTCDVSDIEPTIPQFVLTSSELSSVLMEVSLFDSIKPTSSKENNLVQCLKNRVTWKHFSIIIAIILEKTIDIMIIVYLKSSSRFESMIMVINRFI